MNPPPGYTSRPATQDDLDAIAVLVEALDRADVGLSDPVRDELLWEWSAPRFDLARDARVVLDRDGELVAYADVHAHDPSVQLRSWSPVHPAHRDGPLLDAAVDWVEGHARSLLPEGTRDTPLRHGVTATDRRTASVLVDHGFSHVRTFSQMARALGPDEPEPEPIDGITIRPSERGEDDRAIYDVDDRSFRDHFGYEAISFEEWSEQTFSDPVYDPSLVFLAFEGERAVGVNLGLVQEGVGWVGALGVLDAWRRRGIGRALLHRGFAELGRRGIVEVRLGVDVDNASRAAELYEEAGMTVRRAWHVYEKPISAG